MGGERFVSSPQCRQPPLRDAGLDCAVGTEYRFPHDTFQYLPARPLVERRQLGAA